MIHTSRILLPIRVIHSPLSNDHKISILPIVSSIKKKKRGRENKKEKKGKNYQNNNLFVRKENIYLFPRARSNTSIMITWY